MFFLTLEQHQEIVRRLRDLVRNHMDRIPYHSAGREYTSLMVCFLMHNLSVAETLLKLADSFGNTWFPVTIGYTVTRTMFEADVTAHYITQDPVDRARQYIEFGRVLNKKKLDACSKHRNSKDPQWREAMDLMWQGDWVSRERDVNDKFNAVVAKFTRKDQKRKTLFKNWSGKALRQMAEEVDHVEAYDIFYAELSSFTHVDVHFADCFLQHRLDGPIWSQRATEFDTANVFRHAAGFLTCYLELFSRQFKTWSEDDVRRCWMVEMGTK